MHENERQITLRSTLIVGMLERERAAFRYGLSCAAFAEKIGLSENLHWKRAQAARIMLFYPETKAMIERGETCVSSLVLLSAKLTAANKDILLAGFKGKSKRETKELLSIVTLDGRMLELEPTIEVKLVLTKTQLAKLDRACEILASCGKTPEYPVIFEKALDDLLWRRDPMQKAKRAELRAEKKLTSLAKDPIPNLGSVPTTSKIGLFPENVTLAPSPAKQQISTIDSIPTAPKRGPVPETLPLAPSPTKEPLSRSRKTIPSAIRHQVPTRKKPKNY